METKKAWSQVEAAVDYKKAKKTKYLTFWKDQIHVKYMKFAWEHEIVKKGSVSPWYWVCF